MNSRKNSKARSGILLQSVQASCRVTLCRQMVAFWPPWLPLRSSERLGTLKLTGAPPSMGANLQLLDLAEKPSNLVDVTTLTQCFPFAEFSFNCWPCFRALHFISVFCSCAPSQTHKIIFRLLSNLLHNL